MTAKSPPRFIVGFVKEDGVVVAFTVPSREIFRARLLVLAEDMRIPDHGSYLVIVQEGSVPTEEGHVSAVDERLRKEAVQLAKDGLRQEMALDGLVADETVH
ncbi:hypothetical protein A2856_04340 [Candidatus Uhrbacteria bacterium RIFCSPHIGHO2_01_FULL_63_20]|uniref:Uncharacterized protein n=1 Tax=Candidatus Uhrbacteria bacterium RIFCSPHIGHO2_01_FULL_63_20 TaxID=1802385 RepID=A0A1F7TMM6_9BACT|nr:MAG: hypothetical protein A2856_04340 [Candidatus Uhrbacteria bacterium RIFCSPHIGHO2_01_FULL_63_20]